MNSSGLGVCVLSPGSQLAGGLRCLVPGLGVPKAEGHCALRGVGQVEECGSHGECAHQKLLPVTHPSLQKLAGLSLARGCVFVCLFVFLF